MQEQELVNEIAKLVAEQLKNKDVYNPEDKIPIGVSARHVHLTHEDVETLFGKGYQLTKKKELMGGQYASQECVTLIGTKLRAIENVRILATGEKPVSGGSFQNGCDPAWHQSAGTFIRRSGRLRAYCIGGTERSSLSERRMYHCKASHSYVSGRCCTFRSKG